MSWINDPAIRALSGALEGLQARSQAIASNISNIDTPGYTPVRVDFETELSRQLSDAGITVAADGTVSVGGDGPAGAVSAAVAPVRLARTDPSHLDAPADAGGSGLVEESYLASYRNDGNAVDVDASMTSLAETQLKYGASTRLLSGQFGMLRDVITSQGGR